ncbi:TPA: hypothetical protein KDY87_004624 [Vibrio parahaemolyticus]|nr:hypothetical protein [Vibrio parahaemolyticus]
MPIRAVGEWGDGFHRPILFNQITKQHITTDLTRLGYCLRQRFQQLGKDNPMSNIDKITQEMEAEVKRSKGGVFWRLLLVWMKEVNKQIQNKPNTDDELAEA